MFVNDPAMISNVNDPTMTSNVNDPTMISNVNDPAMASIVNDLTHKIGSSEFRETKKMIAIEQKSTE